MKINNQIQIHKQRGVIALFVTIVMLLLISMVTILTARAVINEQHVSSNLLREKAAYENAEAGLQFAKDYLRSGYDHDGDGAHDTNIMAGVAVDPSLPVPTVNLSATPGGLGDEHVLITSTGTSDDGLGSRVVYEERLIAPLTGGSAPYPLITRTNVAIGGTGDIRNYETNATVWSGNNATITGAGSTFISDGNNGIQEVSNRTTMGVDIVDHDSRLAALSGDEFFSNFFNGSKELIHSQAIELVPGDEAQLDLASFNNNQLIWITGTTNLNANTTIGCTVDYDPSSESCLGQGGEIAPVILIVDGSFRSNGTVDLYGILYVIGDLADSPVWNANGTFNVYGSVIVEEDVNINGTLNITYDSDVLGGFANNHIASKMSNSWRDF
ncbi:MAG: hypothetical protein IMF09_03285 [Proteobacteria bacterium]|nr:hypothetical protein [Pseudomonadota bacterium]